MRCVSNQISFKRVSFKDILIMRVARISAALFVLRSSFDLYEQFEGLSSGTTVEIFVLIRSNGNGRVNKSYRDNNFLLLSPHLRTGCF